MSDLRELYQQVILDHNRSPRNHTAMENADHTAEGFNPLCGDEITVYVKLTDGRVENISFVGHGCAISQASASLMTERLKGKTIEEFQKLFGDFHEMVTGEPGRTPDADALGKLAVFAGVCEFPMRVKCATLAWHTAKNAIAGAKEQASTE